MLTRAKLVGDEWVINGTKNWISNLGIADFYVVFAVTDPQACHAHGITAFVVEADRPGFSVGKLERKLGIRGSPTGQPISREVRAPSRTSSVESTMASRSRWRMLDRSRLGVAAQALGSPRAPPITPPPTPASAAVRQANQRLPGDPDQARRHGDPVRRGARAPLPGVRQD